MSAALVPLCAPLRNLCSLFFGAIFCLWELPTRVLKAHYVVLDLMLVDVVLLLAQAAAAAAGTAGAALAGEHLKLPQLAFSELSLLLTAPSPASLVAL